MDLLGIQPHKVSFDLGGYSFLIYGDPKTGKTTISSQFPNALLLAFEKGYAAIPGIMVQPVNTWGEFKQVLKELKKEEVKQKFSTIVIDTADIAYDRLIDYICANAPRKDGGYGVDKLGDIPYGQGFGMAEKEFDVALRSIVQMGYGVVIISHAADKTYTDANGGEYQQIGPTVDKRGAKVINRMVDIIGYARAITDPDTNITTTKLFMRGTPRYVAGSRFKYTPEYIDFNYKSLVGAIADAIDKQAKENSGDLFTNERQNLEIETATSLNFDALISEFNEIVNSLISKGEDKFQSEYQPKIVEITEKYLGKGGKVNACTSAQSEAINLIVGDLKELIK